MATSATQLEEIVVTSLGIKREKKALTYSAQSVARRVTKSRELNAINSLQGKVAGLDLIRSNAGVGSASTRVVLRGNRSISGNNQPLYVVDGVPIQNSMFFTNTVKVEV